jgi:hypothetical protein
MLTALSAQGAEDWLWEEEKPEAEKLEADFIKVNYEKKDARLAMLMSMVLPGAGQFYANKSAFTTYLFPILEIGLAAGSSTTMTGETIKRISSRNMPMAKR